MSLMARRSAVDPSTRNVFQPVSNPRFGPVQPATSANRGLMNWFHRTRPVVGVDEQLHRGRHIQPDLLAQALARRRLCPGIEPSWPLIAVVVRASDIL